MQILQMRPTTLRRAENKAKKNDLCEMDGWLESDGTKEVEASKLLLTLLLPPMQKIMEVGYFPTSRCKARKAGIVEGWSW